MEAGKLINQISNRLRRRSLEVQERLGISAAKGNILDYILVEGESRPVYQRDIEREFGYRPPTATQVLRSLEGEGLIRRVPDERDGRCKRLLFTEKAQQLRQELRREILRTEEVLLEGVSEKERGQILKALEKMLENLEQEERSHG